MSTYSDVRRLQHVIDNLIVNAIAATPVGGSVVFGATLRHGSVVLSVRDEAGADGTVRLKAAFVEGNGSGLGLRVVHAMVSALEAQLTVESIATESTVYFALKGDPRGATSVASTS